MRERNIDLAKAKELICGGKIDNNGKAGINWIALTDEFQNEEIIKVEIKDSDNERYKTVEFTSVETDKKGGKYRIISCLPKKEPQNSIIKTIKTNYQINP